MTPSRVCAIAAIATMCLFAGLARATPTLTFTPEFQLQANGVCCATGDITGDGRPDFLFLAAGDALHDDKIAVFSAGGGFGPAPDFTLGGPAPGRHFNGSVAGGDINGDGIADLVFGGDTVAYVYLGPIRAGAAPDLQLRPEPLAARDTVPRFGCSVAIAPDVDGDGYADIVVGASDGDPGAFVFLGGATPDSIPDIGIARPFPWSGYRFGRYVYGVGDMDGDGRGEIAVGDSISGQPLRIYRRGAGSSAQLWATIDRSIGSFYGTVVPLGRFDADTRADLLVWDYWTFFHGQSGSLLDIYSGADAGANPRSFPNRVLEGMIAAAAGDLDGDGGSDLLVAPRSRYYPQSSYTVLMYRSPNVSVAVPDDSLACGTWGQIAIVGDMHGDGHPDFVFGTTLYNQHEVYSTAWTLLAPSQAVVWPIGATRELRWSGATRANLAWLAADGTRTPIARNVGGSASNSYALQVPRLTSPQAQIEFTPGDSTGATGRTLTPSVALTDSVWTTYFHTTARPGATHGRMLHWDTWPPLTDLKQYAIDRRTLVGTWWRMVDSLRDTVYVDVGGEQPTTYRLVTVNRLGESRIAGVSVPLDTLPPADTTDGGGAPGDTLLPPGIARAYPQPCGASGCTIVLGVTSVSPQSATVRLFDAHGAWVRTLTGTVGVAPTTLAWDGRDGAGRLVASGVYDARIASGTVRHRARILVVR